MNLKKKRCLATMTVSFWECSASGLCVTFLIVSLSKAHWSIAGYVNVKADISELMNFHKFD